MDEPWALFQTPQAALSEGGVRAPALAWEGSSAGDVGPQLEEWCPVGRERTPTPVCCWPWSLGPRPGPLGAPGNRRGKGDLLGSAAAWEPQHLWKVVLRCVLSCSPVQEGGKAWARASFWTGF